MATFTLELYKAIEFAPKNVDIDDWLGLKEYPIFDEAYRTPLNKKIKEHYMFQEIGHETIAQFRFRLRVKMNEIMPMYNELCLNTRKQFDPLVTIDMVTNGQTTGTQTSSSEQTNKTDSEIGSLAKSVSSNFPQVLLAGNRDYASSGADSNSTTKTTADVVDSASGENSSSDTSESRTKGYQGSPAQLLLAARSLIMNVDMLVIGELEPLFMMVWNTSDEYSQTNERFNY